MKEVMTIGGSLLVVVFVIISFVMWVKLRFGGFWYIATFAAIITLFLFGFAIVTEIEDRQLKRMQDKEDAR